jgi:hypothetical protein
MFAAQLAAGDAEPTDQRVDVSVSIHFTSVRLIRGGFRGYARTVGGWKKKKLTCGELGSFQA